MVSNCFGNSSISQHLDWWKTKNPLKIISILNTQ
jgi:hypothetical protein